jgi:hypothetical protein
MMMRSFWPWYLGERLILGRYRGFRALPPGGRATDPIIVVAPRKAPLNLPRR